MQKIAQFIVKQKTLISIAVLAITIFCLCLIPKVNVNYDMSKYLPKDSEVYQGLNIMAKTWGLIDSAEVMVENVTPQESLTIYQKLSQIEGIDSVTFDAQNQKYYQNNNALFSLTLSSKTSLDNKKILNEIRDELQEYHISLGGSAVSGEAMTNTLQKEMPIFLIIALGLILIVLLLISNSWLEPLLFLSISAIAIVINYGTNLIFNEVSFVTFAIAALLQLALSMDYSIMLLDQYHHESKESNKKEAMVKAWTKSFHAISASSLTTLFGLLAMLFMSFTIGKDLGLVLAKGILINVLVVFLALPSFILIFDRWLSKTSKKALTIPTKALATFGMKGRHVIAIVIVLLTVGSFFIQSKLSFSYSLEEGTKEAIKIENQFGHNNQFVLIYKKADQEKVKELISFLENYKIEDTLLLNHITDYSNTIAREVSKKEVTEMTNLDQAVVAQLFTLYQKTHQTTKETIALKDLLTFVLDEVSTDSNYQAMFTKETAELLKQAKKQLEESEKLLVQGDNQRMIFTINAATESEEANAFYQEFHSLTKEKLGESYLLGETALASSIEDTFASETLLITAITILSMILVIALVYRSFGLPVILVTLIQSAIWISLCYPVLKGNSLFFLAYIIVQCIQMGATIDYAILLSSNYINQRQKQSKKEAIHNALKASVMTIFTSATILIVATFTIALISSQEMISTICMVIGRGTLISAILVLVALPACLVLCDKFLEKTTWKKNFYKETKEKDQ